MGALYELKRQFITIYLKLKLIFWIKPVRWILRNLVLSTIHLRYISFCHSLFITHDWLLLCMKPCESSIYNKIILNEIHLVAFQYVPLIAFYTENIYTPKNFPILSYFKPLLELNGGYKWIYPVRSSLYISYLKDTMITIIYRASILRLIHKVIQNIIFKPRKIWKRNLNLLHLATSKFLPFPRIIW